MSLISVGAKLCSTFALQVLRNPAIQQKRRLLKKMSRWIFTIIDWLFSHAATTQLSLNILYIYVLHTRFFFSLMCSGVHKCIHYMDTLYHSVNCQWRDLEAQAQRHDLAHAIDFHTGFVLPINPETLKPVLSIKPSAVKSAHLSEPK